MLIHLFKVAFFSFIFVFLSRPLLQFPRMFRSELSLKLRIFTNIWEGSSDGDIEIVLTPNSTLYKFTPSGQVTEKLLAA
jgi:hypothetical protein